MADWVGFALRAPGRHRKLALAVFLAVVVLAGTAARILPASYEVRASLLAQRNSLMGVLSNPEVNRELDVPTRAARELVTRRENLIALVKQTNLAERYLATRSIASRMREWLMSTFTGKELTRDRLVDDLVFGLEKKLWVAVGQEGTVTIGFVWSDPQIAFDVVQAAVQGFLEARNAADIGAIGEAITILQVHDARLEKEIATSLAQFDERARTLRARVTVGPRRTSSQAASSPRDEESVRLEGLLNARRRALTDLESFRQRRLSELQVQLEQQLGVYAEGHPTVASTRQAIEALNQPSPQVSELTEEIRRLEALLSQRLGVSSIPSRPFSAGSAQDELAATQARIAEIDDPRLDYERGQIEALLRRRANLVQRIDAARIELDTARAAFEERYKVISPPLMPKGPLRPLGLILWILGVVGGVMAAIVASAAYDLYQGRITERWQVERGLGLVVLAETRKR
jgi:uncharacterized protein involved in exopolysaccharide biosynthesis